jgi:hypothetical protein
MAALASCMTAAMAVLPTFFPRLASFLGIELMRSALLVRGMSTLAASFPRFLGTELMRASFFVSRLPALAGYLPLLVVIHRSKAAVAGTALIAAILIMI